METEKKFISIHLLLPNARKSSSKPNTHIYFQTSLTVDEFVLLLYKKMIPLNNGTHYDYEKCNILHEWLGQNRHFHEVKTTDDNRTTLNNMNCDYSITFSLSLTKVVYIGHKVFDDEFLDEEIKGVISKNTSSYRKLQETPFFEDFKDILLFNNGGSLQCPELHKALIKFVVSLSDKPIAFNEKYHLLSAYYEDGIVINVKRVSDNELLKVLLNGSYSKEILSFDDVFAIYKWFRYVIERTLTNVILDCEKDLTPQQKEVLTNTRCGKVDTIEYGTSIDLLLQSIIVENVNGKKVVKLLDNQGNELIVSKLTFRFIRTIIKRIKEINNLIYNEELAKFKELKKKK